MKYMIQIVLQGKVWATVYSDTLEDARRFRRAGAKAFRNDADVRVYESRGDSLSWVLVPRKSVPEALPPSSTYDWSKDQGETVSSCCGVAGGEFEDYGLCPECKEHCDFVPIEED